MQRFFVTFPLSMDLVLRDTEIVHQLTRVLRIKVAEHIVLFDGDGSETEYEITSIEKKSISLRGYARTFPKTEVSKNITLFQGIPNKYEKIEYILQKGVEIGIRKFVFFRSDHSQKLLITTSKKERFYTIAREALEQCGGLVMPEIVWIDDGSLLTLYQKNEREDITLDTIGSKNVRFGDITSLDIGVWVGPEGGWSEAERQKMGDNGFIFVRFGERILRTETAGIVVSFGLIHG